MLISFIVTRCFSPCSVIQTGKMNLVAMPGPFQLFELWNLSLRVWLLCKTGFVIRKKGCLVTLDCKQVSIKRWSFEIPLKISLLWMIFLTRLLRRQISASQLILEKGLNQMLAKSFRQKNILFGTQILLSIDSTTEFKQTQDWLSWTPRFLVASDVHSSG